MLRQLEALTSRTTAAAGANNAVTKPAVNRRKKTAAIIAGLLISAAVIAYALIPKEVEDIEVSGLEDGTEIYIGDELSPEYKVKPDWFKDETVTFATNDAAVLGTNETGRLKAGIPGEAVLTVKARGYSEDIRVKVVPKVTSIEGIDESISLTTGNTLTLEPVLKPEKFASEPITYTTSDEKVATVSAEGIITAVAAGETELTTSAGGYTVKSKVTVSNPVVVYRSQSSGSKKSSGNNSSKSSDSGPASRGYFDDSDDESF